MSAPQRLQGLGYGNPAAYQKRLERAPGRIPTVAMAGLFCLGPDGLGRFFFVVLHAGHFSAAVPLNATQQSGARL